MTPIHRPLKPLKRQQEIFIKLWLIGWKPYRVVGNDCCMLSELDLCSFVTDPAESDWNIPSWLFLRILPIRLQYLLLHEEAFTIIYLSKIIALQSFQMSDLNKLSLELQLLLTRDRLARSAEHEHVRCIWVRISLWHCIEGGVFGK